MDTAEIDKEIARLNTEIERDRVELDKAAIKLTSVIKKWLPTWIEERIVGTFKSKPEIAEELGQDKVSEMRQETDQLVQSLPADIESKLKNEDLWLHFGLPSSLENERLYDGNATKRFSETFEPALRLLLGRGIPILIKYGYQIGGSGYFDKISEGWRYNIGMPYHNTAMEPAIKEYLDLVTPYWKHEQSLAQAKKQKLQAKATDMWNKGKA